ncbi:hypothetical protein [Aeromicrobium duanguangcaii]|uniref:hypothetical protein n=1 Tax=Aeromicrobium duanguangcaii TaxID=2968086 RepID=UPI0020178DD2|nr:hypothetical protein [Aeromicrobium duanguangcaii]MCL3837518.1 hypothetical protein [Aeromicrobium duanguangcaii]
MMSEPTQAGGDRPDDATTDEAVALLAALDDLDVAEHPQVFEAVHRVLRDQLAGTPGDRG